MTSRSSRVLRTVQQSLKAQAFGLYLNVLHRVLKDHREYSFVKPLYDALRRRDFMSLYTLSDSLASQSYEVAAEHFAANQIALLIRKYPWPTVHLDLKPREAAIKSFHTAERRCGRMNRKFAFLSAYPHRDVMADESRRARHWIRTVIGSRPNYRACFDAADFGPGASVGVHGDATGYSAKTIAEHWTVTPGALHHGYAAIRRNHHLWESLLISKGGYVCYDEEQAFEAYLSRIRMQKNNKVSFVPKTAKTERTIAVEPLLNGLVQKGIDQVLRKKLLRVGLNLADQGLNQRMAREGSRDDSADGFVTIDLKSASDSVSIGIVSYLLPEDWVRLLAKTRSESYELNGQPVRDYHKFCSMGNGFCFPIETLIFSSACVAAGCGVPGVDFTVYGDDIIVRKRFAPTLLRLLRHWGFKINTDKTFLTGKFRESCGADWFGGMDVRPFTLDYALDSLQNIFKFLNLTRRSTRTILFFGSIREHVVRHIPEQYRFFRPFPGLADSGIDSEGSEFMTCSACSYNGYKWRWHELSTTPIVDQQTMRSVGDKPWFIGEALRGGKSMGPNGPVDLHFLPQVQLRNRTQTKIVRKGYVSTSNWLPTPNAS